MQGNLIGVNANGDTALPNRFSGISVQWAGSTVGGPTLSARNVISGNQGSGVYISWLASDTTVAGNLIGTSLNGASAIGNATGLNGGDGIRVEGSTTSVGPTPASAT